MQEQSQTRLAFSPLEAAKAISIGRTTIFAAMRDGSLRARKIGRRTVIDADDLNDWLKSRPVTNSKI